MLALLVLFTVTCLTFTSSYKVLDDQLSKCHIGDIIQNQCNYCVCTHNRIFECTRKQCFRNNDKRNSSVESKQDINKCLPNMIYVKNDTTCICSKNGKWPHEECSKAFQSLAGSGTQNKCIPNSYAVVDCNVCKCDANGNLDKKHCTKNVCQNDITIKNQVSRKSSQVYGKCEANNWYSLAPCQFCFCANENKLVCNTGYNYVKKLELGSYDLSVCGKDFIKEAIELMPKNDKTMRQGKVKENIPEETMQKNNKIPLTAAIEVGVKSAEKLASENKPVNYYSESEEGQGKLEVEKYAVRNGLSTQVPYEEYDNRDYEAGDKNNLKDDSESEFSTENTKEKETIKLYDISSRQPAKEVTTTPSPILKTKKGLYLDIPNMLDKVFGMIVRKSMVSITNNSNCEPGSMEVVKCNTCFCLKNSKMLCTNKKCK